MAVSELGGRLMKSEHTKAKKNYKDKEKDKDKCKEKDKKVTDTGRRG